MTSPQRQANYRAKLEKKGIVPVTVHVPKEGKEAIHKLAKELRDQHLSGG